jgi:Rieske Fe-S protein
MAESSRRTVLACAGAACATVLTGCSTYNSNSGGVNAPQGSQPAETDSASAASASGAAGGNAPAALASTSQVPVGGGTILTAKKIVITQPQSGTFKAFTAVCTHAGCTVGSVSGGTINCPCHGSRFNIANGAVVNGPAASPLAAINIKVQGTSIVQA